MVKMMSNIKVILFILSLIFSSVEFGVNIWNIININEIIQDPNSGFGKEFFFDSLRKSNEELRSE